MIDMAVGIIIGAAKDLGRDRATARDSRRIDQVLTPHHRGQDRCLPGTVVHPSR
ncbi:hypothetical protein [Litorivivens lipolytica]|uniref:hypothetical protein n=1 Tax=Litorivivens lipolytica TaxID=1524264 RepID=UPI003CCD3876